MYYFLKHDGLCHDIIYYAISIVFITSVFSSVLPFGNLRLCVRQSSEKYFPKVLHALYFVFLKLSLSKRNVLSISKQSFESDTKKSFCLQTNHEIKSPQINTFPNAE